MTVADGIGKRAVGINDDRSMRRTGHFGEGERIAVTIVAHKATGVGRIFVRRYGLAAHCRSGVARSAEQRMLDLCS